MFNIILYIAQINTLDGGLLFPSYHLLVPGYIHMPQTHVLGSQGNYHGEDGIPHAVVDGITSANMDMDMFLAHNKKIKMKRSSIDDITIPDIFGKLIVKKVQWVELEIDMTAHLNIEKYYNPTERHILTSSILHPHNSDIDIMVILGEPLLPKAEYYVLACLFLKNHSLQTVSLGRNSHELFNHIKNLLPKGGYETARSGGALGLCHKRDEIRTFIYKRGSFPRKRTCCRLILVNTVSRCGVLCYYCKKKTNEYTCWFYNTPRIGGHVKLELKSTNEFPIFGVFPECRIQTAIILVYFNKKATSLNERCARSKAAHYFLDEMWTIRSKLNEGQVLGQNLSIAAEHTLVTHPVGYHLDSFSKNGGHDIIENKICLVNKQKSDYKSDFSLGRGGCGPGIFVYAILDWGVSTSTQTMSSRVVASDMQKNGGNWDRFIDNISSTLSSDH